MTEEKAKKSPAGGVLVGKREGQTIIHDKGTQGGYFVGKLHKEGGIQGINKSTGQPIEVQGGEVIITAPAVADQTKREFEGEMLTNREILSKINEKGGGVSLENGGEIYYTGSSYNYGGKTMTDYEIMQAMNGCGCDDEYEHGGLSKGKSVEDIAIMHDVTISHINSQLKKGIKVENEHTTDKKLAEKIAKDHLVENPDYYTILDKVGLKDGGKIMTYKNKYNKKYGYPSNESHDLEEIAKDTGISLKGLQQIYNKGIGAYKTNPESVRPNVKSKEQWAMARVYSAVMGGKASKIDANELKMNYGGQIDLEKESKKGDHTARDFNNYNDLMDVGVDGQVGSETGLFAVGGGIDDNYKNIPIHHYISNSISRVLDERLYQQASNFFSKNKTDDFWHFSTQYLNNEQVTYEIYSEKGSYWLNFKHIKGRLNLESAIFIPLNYNTKEEDFTGVTHIDDQEKEYNFSDENNYDSEIEIDNPIFIENLDEIKIEENINEKDEIEKAIETFLIFTEFSNENEEEISEALDVFNMIKEDNFGKGGLLNNKLKFEPIRTPLN